MLYLLVCYFVMLSVACAAVLAAIKIFLIKIIQSQDSEEIVIAYTLESGLTIYPGSLQFVTVYSHLYTTETYRLNHRLYIIYN